MTTSVVRAVGFVGQAHSSFSLLAKIAEVIGVDIRELVKPTTKGDSTTLYIKDDDGNLVDVGTLKRER